MVQGVIFDMDGLMFDTEPMWRRCWRPAFERAGLDMVHDLPERVPGMSKSGTYDYVSALYDGDPRATEAVSNYYEIAHETFSTQGAPKMKGLDELLSTLSELGIPCAVASSSYRSLIELHLNKGGIAERFAVIVSGDMGLASKPAPDIFLEAARQLGTDPAETLVLEDSENGIRAGAAGGFITVFVPDISRVSDEARALATHICESLLEVRSLL